MWTSAHDRDLLRLRRWAALFDNAFRIPGTRITFGIDPLVGLIPVLGDLASPALSLLILVHGARLKVPKVVLVRMVLNAVIDFAAGAIPLLGDLFDFGWKSNVWNLALLDRHARPGVPATAGDWLFVGVCALFVVAVAVLPVLLIVWLGRGLL